MKKKNKQKSLPIHESHTMLKKMIKWYYILSFIIGSYIYINELTSFLIPIAILILGIVVGILILYKTGGHKKEGANRNSLLHMTIAYGITGITAFFYSLAMYRNDSLTEIMRIIICLSSLLVYYSIYVNAPSFFKNNEK